MFIIIFSQAPRPSPGPHKLRESMPLIIFLRNRLKYALNGDEAKKIVKKRLIKVDGKVRTDLTFPAGFMGTNVCLFFFNLVTFSNCMLAYFISLFITLMELSWYN